MWRNAPSTWIGLKYLIGQISLQILPLANIASWTRRQIYFVRLPSRLFLVYEFAVEWMMEGEEVYTTKVESETRGQY